MTLEMILGAIGLLFAVIASAFGLGHSRGSSKAEASAEQQRTDDIAAATKAVAARRVDAMKGASDAHKTVNSSMSDDDVDRELRQTFTRKT